jgi:hypothetical protein
MRKKCRSAREDLERAAVGRTSGAAAEGLSVQTRGTQKQIEALTAGQERGWQRARAGLCPRHTGWPQSASHLRRYRKRHREQQLRCHPNTLTPGSLTDRIPNQREMTLRFESPSTPRQSLRKCQKPSRSCLGYRTRKVYSAPDWSPKRRGLVR